MTLNEVMQALVGNEKLYVTLTDGEGEEMITFNASGYQSVESDILAYTVTTITITSPTKVSMVVSNV